MINHSSLIAGEPSPTSIVKFAGTSNTVPDTSKSIIDLRENVASLIFVILQIK